MPKIIVHKAFSLLLSHTSGQQRFEVGDHAVSDEVATHWYTREHATVAGRVAAAKPAAAKPPEAL